MVNILTIIKYQLIKYTRQPMVIMFAILFPVFWIWLSNSMYSGEPSSLFKGLGVLSYMFPSYNVLAFLVTGLNGVPTEMAHAMESKMLTRLQFTSLKKNQYLLGIVISNFIVNLISVFIMFLEAKIIGKINVPNLENLVFYIICALLTQLLIISMGIIIVNILHGFQNVLYTSLMVYFISLFASGATIPLQFFPKSMLDISKFIPFTYSIKLMLHFWTGIRLSNCRMIFIFMALLTVFCCFIATISFNWENKKL